MPITILSQSARIGGLQDDGAIASSLDPVPCRASSLPVQVEGAGDNRTGLWECTPGRFSRHLANAEIMHILAGACTFTPEGGETREIRAGDTLFFPANTRGVWDIRETVRKVYVVIA